MKYDVYIQRLSPDADFPDYGVEIIPPLGELAAQGVCHYLTRRSSERETNDTHTCETAVMTRNDASGTALIFHPNEDLIRFDYAYAALTVETAINPTGSDSTEVVPHYPEYGINPDQSS